MLYSHLNPLVYLIVLKKFQQYHIDVLIYFRKTLFFEELSAERYQSKHVVDKPQTGCSDKIRIKKLKVLFLIFVAISGLCLTTYCQYLSKNDGSLAENAYSETLRQLPKRFKVGNRIDYNQLQPYPLSVDEQCDENRAYFNYFRKRCFFVLQDNYQGYNLTESTEQCHSRGAVLSYPRHYEEVSDTWIYFNSYLQRSEKRNMKDLLANTTLHVGFRKIGKNEFQSVDGKLNVSDVTHPFMLSPASPFEFTFRGPAICINRYKTLKQCMPRKRNQFAVCSIDLM